MRRALAMLLLLHAWSHWLCQKYLGGVFRPRSNISIEYVAKLGLILDEHNFITLKRTDGVDARSSVNLREGDL